MGAELQETKRAFELATSFHRIHQDYPNVTNPDARQGQESGQPTGTKTPAKTDTTKKEASPRPFGVPAAKEDVKHSVTATGLAVCESDKKHARLSSRIDRTNEALFTSPCSPCCCTVSPSRKALRTQATDVYQSGSGRIPLWAAPGHTPFVK